MDRRPSFNGVALWPSQGTRSGALLQLRKPERSSQKQVFDGYEVETVPGSRSVIVRGLSASSASLHEEALDAANRGLDILAAKGVCALTLDEFERQNILWYEDVDGPIVKIAANPRIEIYVGQVETGVATNSTWNEGFRYFRLSQTTDDLFDAFRNMYLAVEAVLSTAEPQRPHPSNPARLESEGAWLRRALTLVDSQMPLSKYLRLSHVDSVQGFMDEIYGGARTGVFHAKQGRKVFLPFDAADRSALRQAFQQLSSFYVDLASQFLGVRYGSNFIFTGMAQLMFDNMLGEAPTILLSTSESEESDANVLEEIAGQHFKMLTIRKVELDDFFDRGFEASTVVGRDICESPLSSMIIANGDAPVAQTTFEGSLDLQGFNYAVAEMKLRVENTGMLRESYAL